MTPQEFKEARHQLRLSIKELANILNVNARTVRYWEDEGGARPPNPIACRVLEWLENGIESPQHPSSTSTQSEGRR